MRHLYRIGSVSALDSSHGGTDAQRTSGPGAALPAPRRRGSAPGDAGRHVPAGRHGRGRGRGARGPRPLGGALRAADGGARVPPQLADPHERRASARAAGRLLRAPGGRRPGADLRRAQVGRAHPPVGWRNRLLLLPAAPEGRPGAHDPRRGQRPGLLHPRLRRGDRDHQAGRRAARRQHGGAARGPPRHPRLRRRQAGARARQLQRVGRRHRRLHGGGGGGAELPARSTRAPAPWFARCRRAISSAASPRTPGPPASRGSSSSTG